MALIYTVIHNHLEIYSFIVRRVCSKTESIEICLLRSPAGCSHSYYGPTVKIRKANYLINIALNKKERVVPICLNAV